jgi:hypothetical protein
MVWELPAERRLDMKRAFSPLVAGRLAGLAFFAILSPAIAPAWAGVVVEDFSYASSALQGKGGGSGWSGNWGASTGGGALTSRVLADSSANLTSPLYNITQSGTGYAYGDYNAFRGINRYVEPDLAGAGWFSALVRNTNAAYHAGIEFNTHADAPYAGSDYAQGPWDVELSGTSLIARYNGVNSASLATLALNQTHLILGRLTLGAGNDTMEVWADPLDMLSLGSPLFSAGSANMGADLYLAGVFAFGNVNNNPALREGRVDALRISDGDGSANDAFTDVTGIVIPEPVTLVLAALAVAGMGGYLRRRQVV